MSAVGRERRTVLSVLIPMANTCMIDHIGYVRIISLSVDITLKLQPFRCFLLKGWGRVSNTLFMNEVSLLTKLKF